MAASEDTITDDGNHTVELTVLDNEESAANGGSAAASSEEITPLLTQIERPKINIFSVSRSRRKPRELVIKASETEISPVSQFMLWAWSGSRYSGLLCMALSSVIYFVMEILSENFTGKQCCYQWRKAHPSIQRIPFSLAILLSFTTPIMASIVARIILYEKLKITEIGGLACSFSGMLFIFQQMLTTQGTECHEQNHVLQFCFLFLDHGIIYTVSYNCALLMANLLLDVEGGLQKTEEASNSSFRGSNHIYAALIGFFSSITGGISYCLIKAAAKATDQPVVTVLSFAILASPAAGICTFAFEEFVLPSFNSLSLMLALGILSFLAEVFLAHGLQLEKINKAANVMFMEAALSQLWGIGTSSIAPSLGRLVGCLLILISVSFTMFFGPEKENE
ncbi:pgi [Gossypium arboreum]|uniref:Pgi n=1 Tax=Gossypium arboreum TaxID=29729 RepID=A0A0B0P614_GOSAR|nr:pgi [Gossypium arboreum]